MLKKILKKIYMDSRLYLLIPDRIFIKIYYWLKTGRSLNLKDPQSFNEKIQWLKLYNRNPQYTQMVDKYSVREYIAAKIGEEYLIPLIGVWNDFDEIDFASLPNQFVLKCTHDSGSAVICRDKEKFDIKVAGKSIRQAMKYNYYYLGREWVYRDVRPRIIAEVYLGENINDYKLFAFNGMVAAIQVDFDRYCNHRRNIYTAEWTYIPLSILYPTAPEVQIKKPEKLDEMISIAEKLSEGIPHVRVDLYFLDNKVYFGELTFHHGGGGVKSSSRRATTCPLGIILNCRRCKSKGKTDFADVNGIPEG